MSPTRTCSQWAVVFAMAFIGLSASAEEVLLSGFEQPLKAEWKNITRKELVPFKAETRSEMVKQGNSSALWENLTRNKWLSLIGGPTDWSRHDAISLWVHSAAANGQKINLTVSAPSEKSEEGYYIHSFAVDWVGWRHLVMPLAKFKPNRSPAPWSRITEFRINAGGWGAEPLPDTVLHLDDLRLIKL